MHSKSKSKLVLLVEIDNLTVQFIWIHKKSRIAKITLKSKVKWLKLPYLIIKLQLPRKCDIGIKIDK